MSDFLDDILSMDENERQKFDAWYNLSDYHLKYNSMHQKNKTRDVYLSRMDYRFIYEYRNKMNSARCSVEHILTEEINDLSNDDVIHIVAPHYGVSAMSIGFFLAWDIREFYSKHSKNVEIVGHYILPNATAYYFNSNYEREIDYSYFTAFVKELICINEVCNGVIDDNISKYFYFEIEGRFDSEKSFKKSIMLPFDYICFLGQNEMLINAAQCMSFSEMYEEFSKNVSDYESRGISCRLPGFRDVLYKRHPQFSKDGYAGLAYSNTVDKLRFNQESYLHSPHLDYRWNISMRNI